MIRCTTLLVWGLISVASLVSSDSTEISKRERTVTDLAIFDISVTEKNEDRTVVYAGRLVIGLFGEVVPMTALNFAKFTEGFFKEGKLHGYKLTKFHRIVQDFVIQGGDFVHHNGTGGTSIYGAKFEDENFRLKFRGRGWLGMANYGRDTNSCQFFISLVRLRWLDGKHVVFGKILNGMKMLERIASEPTDESTGEPKRTVRIMDSTLITLKKKLVLTEEEFTTEDDIQIPESTNLPESFLELGEHAEEL